MFNFLAWLNFLKKVFLKTFTCLSGKQSVKSTSSTAKPTSPGLSDINSFVRCGQCKQMMKQIVNEDKTHTLIIIIDCKKYSYIHATLSLLCSFWILFVKALFSSCCSLQQFPWATSGLSSVRYSVSSSSSLLLSTMEIWKCKPLLGSQSLICLLLDLLGLTSGGWVDSLDVDAIDKVGELQLEEVEWGLLIGSRPTNDWWPTV